MTTPNMASVLEDLAAGRIDAAEAARRIDALNAEPAPKEPSNEELAAAALGSPDPWAAETDRPQYTTHPTESFRNGATDPEPTDPEPAPEPVRAKPVNTSGVERISVRAVGRRVRILGETAVATLSADGPHVLRRNGPVLEVSSDGELGASLDGFSILRGAPRNLDESARWASARSRCSRSTRTSWSTSR